MPRIGPASARPESEAVLQEIEQAFGMVPNLFRTYAHHPPLLRANWEKTKAVMSEGALARKLKEAIALHVSRDNGCDYCVAAHTAALRAIGVGDAELEALEQDPEQAGFDDKERALLRFARRANGAALAIGDDEYQAVRAAGASEAEIVEALGVMELFAGFNRFLDSLQVDIDF